MFKLQRLEISGFKSFADPTEIVFTGSGITAVVGPNGCGKSNVADAIAWVLGEQRAKLLRGSEMKDVVFQGTKNRKPGGMAEVVLHLVRDDTTFDIDENELEDIDASLGEIDDSAVDMDAIEGAEPEQPEDVSATAIETNGFHEGGQVEEVETVKAMAVGSTHVVENRVKTKRHWRPRSFALDFAPGEAVSVTRRLYMSGESEYLLNGRTCRLRDITDLFAGTCLSGAHYAIIEQGKIGQILSAKPADRRSLIEEAAGISKFRARQRAAESRLETAKSNLSRITDIVSEVEKQVNSLRRQAAKTRRYKILQEEFRTLLRQLYAAEGRHLSELSDTLKNQLETAVAAEIELEAQVAAKEEAARESTHRARLAEESLAELRKIHANNALERDRAEREHLYKSDQIVSLNNRCETLRQEIAASEERQKALAAELARLEEIERHESAEHAAAEAALRESEDSHREASDTLSAIEASMDEARNLLIEHTAAAERFDEITRQAANSIDRLGHREHNLREEHVRADETFATNNRQAEELAAMLVGEENKLADLNAEKEQLVGATAAAREALHDADAQLRLLEEEHSAKKHRLATLLELEEKRAVYTPQVQKIFAEESSIGVRFAGVLADRLNVAPEAERAVEAVLGPFLEAVVVRTLGEARRLGEWLRSNEMGRTPIIILPEEEPVSHNISFPADRTIGSFLGVSNELEQALRRIFPREMSARLVASLEDGAMDSETRVDHTGNLLVGGRLFIGGLRSSESENESLLAFKRELKDLESECGRLTMRIESAAGEAEKLRAALVDLESRTVDLQSLIIKVDRGIHGLQIQVHGAREEIQRAERHRKVVEDEIGQTRDEITELIEKKTQAETGKQTAVAARAEASGRLETIAVELGQARARTEAASAELNEKRMVAATSDERRRSAVSALRRVENEVRDLESRLALQNLELSDADAKIRTLHAEITEITDRIASAGDAVSRETEEITAAVTALTSSRDAADRMSDELNELNHRAAAARNERAGVEIRQAEAVTELKNLAENCRQELNLALTELVDEIEPAEGFVLDDARSEVSDLRTRLDNFGAINMLALEELGEAEERNIFLTSQRQDIVDSIDATEEALREIKQRSRERFRTAFEAINANFSELFLELFGGGQGQMTLMESDDILEAGIEVVAQPPGKRLQNILLLSGGEKAMTAIALILGIFRYRPSPFCLLDEVDAPLDDANIGRFANKIAEMAEKTQFIVITHNKQTMEAARALYGVTMQEAGVSKVVSVKFA